MAQNAKDIQLRDLKDLTNELRETNRLLKKMLEESQKREEELKQERDNLKGQVDYLTKKLFGSSSEKGIGQIPGQMGLFNEVRNVEALWRRSARSLCAVNSGSLLHVQK